jgi:hypothetical protein
MSTMIVSRNARATVALTFASVLPTNACSIRCAAVIATVSAA